MSSLSEEKPIQQCMSDSTSSSQNTNLNEDDCCNYNTINNVDIVNTSETDNVTNVDLENNKINMKKNRKSIFKNYIVRDILIWLAFLIVLPLFLFGIYNIAKYTAPSPPITISISSTQSPLPSLRLAHILESKKSEQETYLNDKVESDLTEDESFESIDRNLKNLIFNFNNQNRPLKRVSLRKYENAICNDGSPANYYIRLSNTNSKSWIILLDGGYFCYDKITCNQRAINSHNLTSSHGSKLYKIGDGILSSSSIENKYWSDVNTVNIPYCSSDLWIGNKKCTTNCTEDFNFMGQHILNHVVDDLIENYSMREADLIVFTGISAGGIGVLMNANKLKEKLEVVVPNAQIKAIVDSSWLLDLPYSFLCNMNKNNENENDCIIHKMFQNLIDYWQAKIPNECSENVKNSWDCFVPSKLMPFIKIDTFVIQNKYDETQILEQHSIVKSSIDNDRKLTNLKLIEANNFIDTIHMINKKIDSSFAGLKYYFIPSCVSHITLTKSDWVQYRVNNVYLQDMIYCWAYDEKKRSNQTENKYANCDLSNQKLIDECNWPNCSRTCPSLKYPDSNKQIENLIEYFSYYGLVTFKNIAHKLKVTERSVRKMSYSKMMKLLIESKNK